MTEVTVKQEVVVDITATATVRVSFSQEYYPDQETIEEAVKFEEDRDPSEMAEMLVDYMASSDTAKISWTVRVEETAVSND
jgi:hypothetical protein